MFWLTDEEIMVKKQRLELGNLRIETFTLLVTCFWMIDCIIIILLMLLSQKPQITLK